MADPVVELVSVRRTFDAGEVLRGVTFALARGETLVVMGGSGSGKTVFLRHVAGLLRPDEGQVRVFGVNIEKLSDSGCLVVGKKGTLYSSNDYGAKFQLLPAKEFEGYKAPKATLPRVHSGHHKEWLQAIKDGKPDVPMANFDYGSRLTEALLLGNVAIAVGQKIEWDGQNMVVTNHKEANGYIRREYRKGWTL